MSNLYDRAEVIMPNKNKITIQKLIDIITLDSLTPDLLDLVKQQVEQQLEKDDAKDAFSIKLGMHHYVIRQIVYYAIKAMSSTT